jgi:hypothetical protein
MVKLAYFWPVYGEHDEVCFPFFASRGAENVWAARASTMRRVPCC